MIFNLINGEEYFEKDTPRIHSTQPMLETSLITFCLSLSCGGKPYTRKDENASPNSYKCGDVEKNKNAMSNFAERSSP
jgi:hypothetical protein